MPRHIPKNSLIGRRVTAAALLATVGVFAGSALGFATSAQAAPVKQIDAYNSCYKQSKPREGSTAASFDCCIVAGGTWTGGTYPDGWCVLKNAPVPYTDDRTAILSDRGVDTTRLAS